VKEKIKKYLIWALVFFVVILLIYGFFQKRRIDRLIHESDINGNLDAQDRIEKEVIPKALGEKTTDELSRMGGVLWE
jgi:hypothetical protein